MWRPLPRQRRCPDTTSGHNAGSRKGAQAFMWVFGACVAELSRSRNEVERWVGFDRLNPIFPDLPRVQSRKSSARAVRRGIALGPPLRMRWARDGGRGPSRGSAFRGMNRLDRGLLRDIVSGSRAALGAPDNGNTL